MVETLPDGKAALEAAGLVVSTTTRNSLQIGAALNDVGGGIHIFEDGCALNPRNGEWVVLFPSAGLQQYHVPGTLADGVSLILAAYHDHRQNGGLFKDACKRVLKDADQYMTGRAPAAVGA